MTYEDRVAAVAKIGFTERQARFLVTVLLHSGVFLGLQYCTHARMTRGTKTQAVLKTLACLKNASD